MDQPVVQTSEGKVIGSCETDAEGTKYHAFLSIPYAKPPIGDLRFKAPQPLESWDGIKECTKQGNICVQFNMVPTPGFEGSEDCLNLHVFTRKLPSEEQKLRPVMVWIHGGGFTLGSNDVNVYGPQYFMTQDIVIVSINYRVGLLGFLSLQDTSLDVPGNAGLKDQVQALKWVQKNIKNFNGDPNNVTIFGESAGAASVEYLVLSPSAKNLFHKAIIASGSTLSPWTRGYFDPADFAKFLGHANLTEVEILKLLTDMPALDLCQAQFQYQKMVFDQPFGLIAPCIEKPNPTAFITEHPIDIIRSGKYNTVPVITGYCDNEGLIAKALKMMSGQHDEGNKESQSINHLLPRDTNLQNAEQVMKLTAKIKEFYARDEYKDNEYLLVTDTMMVSGIIASARNMAKHSKNPVYLYRFSFVGRMNTLKCMLQINDIPGACHGDDLGYQWKSARAPFITEEPEKSVLHRILKMWTNFVKGGNPTPKESGLNVEWKPVQGETINFLDIGKELVVGVNPEEERMKFWREIFAMHPVTSKFN